MSRVEIGLYASQSGPCIICGDTNYNLSCGGPTICPKCDCGQFDAATVEKQARIIAILRARLQPFIDADWYALGNGKFQGTLSGDALDAAKSPL